MQNARKIHKDNATKLITSSRGRWHVLCGKSTIDILISTIDSRQNSKQKKFLESKMYIRYSKWNEQKMGHVTQIKPKFISPHIGANTRSKMNNQQRSSEHWSNYSDCAEDYYPFLPEKAKNTDAFSTNSSTGVDALDRAQRINSKGNNKELLSRPNANITSNMDSKNRKGVTKYFNNKNIAAEKKNATNTRYNTGR